MKIEDEIDGYPGTHEYFIFPSGMKEILSGLDISAVVKALLGKGIVPQGADGKANKIFHVPGAGGKHRLYQIDFAALGGDDGGGDG